MAALVREIADCEQLRAEEPLCRCELHDRVVRASARVAVNIAHAGILDSLVTYKRMLADRLTEQSSGERSEVDSLRLECLELLRELEKIDPMRRARYQDLCKSGRLLRTVGTPCIW